MRSCRCSNLYPAGTKKPSGHEHTGPIRVSAKSQIGARPIAEGLAADAVVVEPVSTTKFPANREKNREFFNSKHCSRLRWPTSPMISMILSQIPYSTEQGIISAEQ